MAKNAPSSSVVINAEWRNKIPLSSQSPRNNSKRGRKCALGLTSCGGSSWYESTCVANIDREVLAESIDQPIDACGFNFAYAAKRKIPASASRPTSSRAHPIDPRVFVVIEFTGLRANRKIASESDKSRIRRMPDIFVPYRKSRMSA